MSERRDAEKSEPPVRPTGGGPEPANPDGLDGHVGGPSTGNVALELPAQVELAILARLVASGIGSHLDFDVEELEDLRIAVDEYFVALVEASRPNGTVRLTYLWDSSAVTIAGTAAASSSSPPVLNNLAAQIISTVTSRHSFTLGDDSTVSFEFDKARGPRSDVHG